MESFHSVPWLTVAFTVVGCPRIHLRIKSRDIREKANGYSTNSRRYEKRTKKREKRTELIISIPQRIAQLSDMLY